MQQTTFAALAAFALVSSITPGPNNMMLMASGANFGLRRTVPHALGVGFGFTLMIVLVGVGLMGLFDLFPVLNIALKIVSVAYLVGSEMCIRDRCCSSGSIPRPGRWR